MWEAVQECARQSGRLAASAEVTAIGVQSIAVAAEVGGIVATFVVMEGALVADSFPRWAQWHFIVRIYSALCSGIAATICFCAWCLVLGWVPRWVAG